MKLAVSGDDSKSLNTKNNIGTRLYMPPEAFKGDCSAKWDVWSFGVVSFPNKDFLSYIGISTNWLNILQVLLEILTGLPPTDETRDDKDIVSTFSIPILKSITLTICINHKVSQSLVLCT